MAHFVIAGASGVGKSHFSKIAENFGYKYVSVSDILREAFMIPEASSKGRLASVVYDYITREGETWLAPLVLEHMSVPNTCVDGLRIALTAQQIKSKKATCVIFLTDCNERDKIFDNENSAGPSAARYFAHEIQKLYMMSDTVLVNSGSFKGLSERKFFELLENSQD